MLFAYRYMVTRARPLFYGITNSIKVRASFFHSKLLVRQSAPYRILSIDGGGIRGIIPAVILQEIEKRANKPICELFDYVAGTSTGSILATGLTVPDELQKNKPKFTASDLLKIYEEKGKIIFPDFKAVRRKEMIREIQAIKGLDGAGAGYFYLRYFHFGIFALGFLLTGNPVGLFPGCHYAPDIFSKSISAGALFGVFRQILTSHFSGSKQDSKLYNNSYKYLRLGILMDIFCYAILGDLA